MSEAAPDGDIPEWTLGWRLQRALAHAGVSVEEMADEIGVSRSTVSRWLNDRGAPPRVGYLKLWALRTGVSWEWVLGRVPALARAGGQNSTNLTTLVPEGAPVTRARAALAV